MARTRVNWIEAKSKYITGNIDDVSEFMSVVYEWHNRSGNYQVRTKGWKEERDAYQARLAERREEALMNSPLIGENAEKLLKAENKIMDIIIKNLDQLDEMIEFDQFGTPIMARNAAALRNMWEMVRIAQDKHTSGAKNENINKNVNITFEDLINSLKNSNAVS